MSDESFNAMANAFSCLKKFKDCDVTKCEFPTQTIFVSEETKNKFMALVPKKDKLNEEAKVLNDKIKELTIKKEAFDAESNAIWAELRLTFPELNDCERISLSKDYSTVTGAFCKKNCLNESIMDKLLEDMISDSKPKTDGNTDVIPE
jgi:hypothetical protein